MFTFQCPIFCALSIVQFFVYFFLSTVHCPIFYLLSIFDPLSTVQFFVHWPLSNFLSTVHCPAILSWSGGGGYLCTLYGHSFTYLLMCRSQDPRLAIYLKTNELLWAKIQKTSLYFFPSIRSPYSLLKKWVKNEVLWTVETCIFLSCVSINIILLLSNPPPPPQPLTLPTHKPKSGLLITRRVIKSITISDKNRQILYINRIL